MRILRDRVAVITGAAGGIGLAIAHALAERGCHLAIADIQEGPLGRAAVELAGRGGHVTHHLVDVSDPAAIERLHDEVLAAHGAAHILVNNAGVTVYGLFAEMPRAQVKRVLDINMWGVIDGCRVFLPTLQAQDEAHIVNIASMAAMTGIPFQAAYCASKSAVKGFSESLRAELAGSPVGVTCVLPGTVRTSILASAATHDARVSGKLGELMLRFGYPPERVAHHVVRAIQRNRGRLVLTPESVATDAMLRLAPNTLRSAMSGLFRLGKFFGATERDEGLE